MHSESTSDHNNMLTFGRIELDLRRASLKVAGKDVRLRSQSFEVLRVLAERSGEMVGKGQLLDEIWGDSAGADESLAQCISDIRRALADTDKIVVRTIPRRGYIFEGDLVAAEEPEESATRSLRVPVYALATVAILAVAFLLWQNRAAEDFGLAESVAPSIAVLPFVDMTTAQDHRHFGEGLSEELLNILAQSEELVVIARTSAFTAAKELADVRSIGDELNVDYVLEGSVRSADETLRISAQLIRTSDRSNIWSQSYDRSMTNVLEIQTDIAASVADAMHATLQNRASQDRAVDPYAHELAMQARSLLHLLGDEGNEMAQELLIQAIEIDPEYVDAYLLLSKAIFQTRGQIGGERHLDHWHRSNDLTNKALEIDPDHPVANAYRAWQELHYYQNFENAARFFERAMALDSKNLDILGIVINALVVLGKPELGVPLGRYLIERDPLCMACYGPLLLAARVSGDHQLAEATIRQALSIVPDNPDMLENLGDNRLVQGDPAGALEIYRSLPAGSGTLMGMAIANHQLGDRREYERIRDIVRNNYADMEPTVVARVEAVDGNVDAAFELLERHLALPTWIRGVNYRSTHYQNLREDPRWEAYLERLGVSERQLEKINFDPQMPF